MTPVAVSAPQPAGRGVSDLLALISINLFDLRSLKFAAGTLESFDAAAAA